MTNTHKDSDDNVFSKNHHATVKYRRRKQEEREADDELKEQLKRMQDGNDPLPEVPPRT